MLQRIVTGRNDDKVFELYREVRIRLSVNDLKLHLKRTEERVSDQSEEHVQNLEGRIQPSNP